jgi:DNA-binding Lrp family transcriptional regulator
MESSNEGYKESLWKLLLAAKRFRNSIEIFRDTKIGCEVWADVNAGSKLVTALEYAEETNIFLIDELRELGVIKREQLRSQDRKLDKELKELGATVWIWVVDTTGVENTRVSHVTVAYTGASGLAQESVTHMVNTALDRTVLNDPDDVVYASDLKYYLEDEGLYGVALQDVRDEKFDQLLAEVIAKGRLLIRLRDEAGLPKRVPKKKKKTDE